MRKKSNKQINDLGEKLKNLRIYKLTGENQLEDSEEAAEEARTASDYNNWAATHFPLIVELDRVIKEVINRLAKNKTRINVFSIAGRIKSISSTIHKLSRKELSDLSSMNDIAGMRVVFYLKSEIDCFIKELENYMDLNKNATFLTLKDKTYDYISKPTDEGYRSIHRVFVSHNKDSETEGMKIELQLRLQHHHSWSTSVELAEVITGRKLKVGDGEKK